MQGKGQSAGALSYQTIDDAIEYDFQLPGHVAPVTGGSYYQHIAAVDGRKYLLGSVFGQYALTGFTAGHTAGTGSYLKFGYKDGGNAGSVAFGFRTNGLQHGGNIAVPARASVENQYIHRGKFLLRIVEYQAFMARKALHNWSGQEVDLLPQ